MPSEEPTEPLSPSAQRDAERKYHYLAAIRARQAAIRHEQLVVLAFIRLAYLNGASAQEVEDVMLLKEGAI